MKTPEEWRKEINRDNKLLHLDGTGCVGFCEIDDEQVREIQLDAWRQGMTDAAAIVHARSDRLADNGIRDTVREHYAEHDILAARDAKGETTK